MPRPQPGHSQRGRDRQCVCDGGAGHQKLVSRYEKVHVCYEAGPTGYGLYRQVRELGHECAVVAPSLIPSKPGERVKTNRRDAVSLARLFRAGELTAVWVPDAVHEAVRDLVRAHASAAADVDPYSGLSAFTEDDAGIFFGRDADIVRGLDKLRNARLFAPPLLRIALAVPFVKSGLTKWSGFLSLSPAAEYLFEDEFKLHIFGQAYTFPFPDTLALIDSIAEIVLPAFLVVGLAMRFSAFGLLVMTGVIQLLVPEGWANFHLPWAALAVAIIAPGPGPLSLDALIEHLWHRVQDKQ